MPPGAGVGSAIGFLRAPFGFESVRSAYVRLSRFDAARVNAVLKELSEEAVSFVKAGAPDVVPIRECTAYMRYVGQGWEIPVPVDIKTYGADGAAELGRRFTEAYVALFGRAIDGLDVEIVSWSLRASSPAVRAERMELTSARADVARQGAREIFDARSGTSSRRPSSSAVTCGRAIGSLAPPPSSRPKRRPS